jgi:hypothetical protein
VCTAGWVLLALISCIPLLVPSVHVLHTDNVFDGQFRLQLAVASLVSVSSSIPSIIDYILDYADMPWIDLVPRLSLIAGLVIPNMLNLITYIKIPSPNVFISVIVCTTYMRINLVRGSMLSYLFRYDYPIAYKYSALLWSFCGAFVSIHHFFSFYLDCSAYQIFNIGNIIVMYSMTVYCIYFSVRLLQQIAKWPSHDADQKKFGIYFFMTWLTCSLFKVTFYLCSLRFFFWGNVIMDFLVATMACYVSAKKFRAAHNRLQTSLESKRAFVRYVAHEIRYATCRQLFI